MKTKRIETYILLVLALIAYLVFTNLSQINFRLLEPVGFVTVILLVAFALRTTIYGFLFDKKVFSKDTFLLDSINLTLIPGILIKSFKQMIDKRIKFKNALIVVLMQLLVTFAVAFYFNAFPTSSGYILMTFTLFTAFYIFYLQYRDKPFIKNVYMVFGLLGLLVIAPGVITFGLVHLLSVIVSFYCFWAFLHGLVSKREYIYSLAIVFLVALPFFLMIEQANPEIKQNSEFIAFCVYMLLVLGVLKDLFYEWIFE